MKGIRKRPTGIEPASPAWKAGVIAIIRRSRVCRTRLLGATCSQSAAGGAVCRSLVLLILPQHALCQGRSAARRAATECRPKRRTLNVVERTGTMVDQRREVCRTEVETEQRSMPRGTLDRARETPSAPGGRVPKVRTTMQTLRFTAPLFASIPAPRYTAPTRSLFDAVSVLARRSPLRAAEVVSSRFRQK